MEIKGIKLRSSAEETSKKQQYPEEFRSSAATNGQKEDVINGSCFCIFNLQSTCAMHKNNDMIKAYWFIQKDEFKTRKVKENKTIQGNTIDKNED